MARKYEYKLEPHEVRFDVMLPLESLIYDHKAQRLLDKGRAHRLSEAWIPEAVGLPCVSDRNGKLRVVDGTHRIVAAKEHGITELPCEVHFGMSARDEAVLFLLRNRESVKPTALDEYEIGIVARIPLFTDTKAVLDAHDVEAGRRSEILSEGELTVPVSGVVRVTERYGAPVLDRTLTVVESAWKRTPATFDGMLIAGVARFVATHGGSATDRQLAASLRDQGDAEHWRTAVAELASDGGRHHSGTMSRALACYQLVLEAWNADRPKADRILAA